MKTMNVGILIFDEVEVLDFAGPFEVFSLAEEDGNKIFNVKLIAEQSKMITARNGLKVLPDFTIEDQLNLDILIIPGGYGAEQIQINNPRIVQWIKQQFDKVQLLASVCTGALLLAKAGLLKNKKATTHWMDLERLEKEFEDIFVVHGAKFVDEGRIITSGGISAGLNMSFYIITKIVGKEVSTHTAKRMEYDIDIT
jgi:transcriptional regulator GlxA family with amidase domain